MTDRQLAMLNKLGLAESDFEPRSIEDRLQALETELSELRSFVNALGKTELQGEGTAENPFILTVGMNLIPNAYYLSNDIRYVYMGNKTAYDGEDLTFDNGWAEF